MFFKIATTVLLLAKLRRLQKPIVTSAVAPQCINLDPQSIKIEYNTSGENVTMFFTLDKDLGINSSDWSLSLIDQEGKQKNYKCVVMGNKLIFFDVEPSVIESLIEDNVVSCSGSPPQCTLSSNIKNLQLCHDTIDAKKAKEFYHLQVSLDQVAPEKIFEIIKIIREFTGSSLRRARTIASQKIINLYISQDQVNDIQNKLKAVGAQITLLQQQTQ